MPSTRPQNHVQRDRCDRAHRNIIAVPGLHAAIVAAFETDFIIARDEYYAHFGEHAAIKATLARRRAEVAAAEEAFHAAFRLWLATITDAAGMYDAAAVSVHFRGVLPGEIPAMSPAEALNLTAFLPKSAAADPAVAGDPARLEALMAARAALAVALEARENVVTGQTDSVDALAELERQFDGAWGSVVRLVVRRAPHLVNKIPVFHNNTPHEDDLVLPGSPTDEFASSAEAEPPKQDAAADHSPGSGPATESPPPGATGQETPPDADPNPSAL
jgi:hypothetical protein